MVSYIFHVTTYIICMYLGATNICAIINVLSYIYQCIFGCSIKAVTVSWMLQAAAGRILYSVISGYTVCELASTTLTYIRIHGIGTVLKYQTDYRSSIHQSLNNRLTIQ